MGRMLLLDNFINKPNNQVEGFCVIKTVTERTNSKGDPYLDMRLYDRGGTVAAKLWDYNPTTHGEFIPDTVVKVRATIVVWNEREQLKIDRIRPLDRDRDDPDMKQLVPCAPFDAEWMYDELYSAAQSISDDELSRFVIHIMDKNREDLLRWPAALKLHHAQRGGLLYHTMTMLKIGEKICEIYPALCADLVKAGIILHDMSKMKELSVGELGLASEYSVEGQLIGHIAMGCAMIEREAESFGLSDDLRVLIEHMILSHHGVPEFGSPEARCSRRLRWFRKSTIWTRSCSRCLTHWTVSRRVSSRIGSGRLITGYSISTADREIRCNFARLRVIILL